MNAYILIFSSGKRYIFFDIRRRVCYIIVGCHPPDRIEVVYWHKPVSINAVLYGLKTILGVLQLLPLPHYEVVNHFAPSVVKHHCCILLVQQIVDVQLVRKRAYLLCEPTC